MIKNIPKSVIEFFNVRPDIVGNEPFEVGVNRNAYTLQEAASLPPEFLVGFSEEQMMGFEALRLTQNVELPNSCEEF